MAVTINTAWKHVIVYRAATTFKPCEQAGAGIWQQLELNRSSGLLLHHDCAGANLSTADNIANLDLHEVAATQLTVDSKVEESSISQAAALVEVEADLPDLLRLQRPLGTDSAPRVPDLTLVEDQRAIGTPFVG